MSTSACIFRETDRPVNNWVASDPSYFLFKTSFQKIIWLQFLLLLFYVFSTGFFSFIAYLQMVISLKRQYPNSMIMRSWSQLQHTISNRNLRDQTKHLTKRKRDSLKSGAIIKGKKSLFRFSWQIFFTFIFPFEI